MVIQETKIEREVNEHMERAAMLSVVIMKQTRHKGFSDGELFVALKMVRLRLEGDCRLRITSWEEKNLESFLRRSYVPALPRDSASLST